MERFGQCVENTEAAEGSPNYGTCNSVQLRGLKQCPGASTKMMTKPEHGKRTVVGQRLCLEGLDPASNPICFLWLVESDGTFVDELGAQQGTGTPAT
jgi:hypothetical protein